MSLKENMQAARTIMRLLDNSLSLAEHVISEQYQVIFFGSDAVRRGFLSIWRFRNLSMVTEFFLGHT